MSNDPRQIIARVHAERAVRWKELGSGDIADTIIAELDACGFVIVPRVPTDAMIAAVKNDIKSVEDADVLIYGAWQDMIDEAIR